MVLISAFSKDSKSRCRALSPRDSNEWRRMSMQISMNVKRKCIAFVFVLDLIKISPILVDI